MSSPHLSRPIWVYFHLNGDHTLSNGVKTNIQNVKTLSDLFTLAAHELNLINMNITLVRVFSQDGVEINDPKHVFADDHLWFSAGEDFEPLPTSQSTGESGPNSLSSSTNPNDPNQPNNNPQAAQQGYLYTAAVFSAGLVQSGYGLMASSIRSHAPQSVINSFNTMESTVSAYTTPYVTSAIPYISNTVTWTDQMVNQCVDVTKQKTQQFMTTPTGQQIQAQFLTPLSDFTQHAVDAFKNATSGANNGNTGNGGQNGQNGQQQFDANGNPIENIDGNGATLSPGSPGNGPDNHSYQSYLSGLKTSMGEHWNNTLLPWAEHSYRAMHSQLTGSGSTPPSGSSPQLDTEHIQHPPQNNQE